MEIAHADFNNKLNHQDLLNLNFCKACGHSKDDHKGMAMICMKQIGKNPDQLCDCNWFDDGTLHVLPMRQNAFTLKTAEKSN
jgi:hypothetical protein